MKAIAKAGFVALILVLGGCPVDNQSSISVLGSPPWEFESAEDDQGNLVVTSCLAPGSADSYRSFDTFDVLNTRNGGGASYSRPFLVRNNLPDNSDETASRLNTNDYVIDTARVEYQGIDDTTQSVVETLATEVPTGITIEAAGGQHGVIVTLIPTNVAQILADQLVPNDGDSRTVIADVTFDGELLDGNGLESQTFRFPINVCRGCDSPCSTGECVCSHFVR